MAEFLIDQDSHQPEAGNESLQGVLQGEEQLLNKTAHQSASIPYD
jgi:hypothetical protein